MLFSVEGNIMKEKIEVYESLRNEILTMEEMQRNVWIYMYVLFCTLFVLGLQWSNNLFLVSYIILIPFQCVINDYRWSISKMSTYIRIFFENEDRNIGWETLQVSEIYRTYDRQKKRSIRNVIGMSGSIHLGLLATSFYCGYTLKDLYSNNYFVLEIENILLIIVSILLFMFLVMLNRAFYRDYDRELEDVIKRYKEDRVVNKK